MLSFFLLSSFKSLKSLLFCVCLCVCQESASSAWEDIDHIQYSSCLKLPAKGIMDIGLGIPVPLGELRNIHHGLNNSESYCKVHKRLEIIYQSMHPAEVFTKFMMSNSAGWLHIQALAFNASLVLLILTRTINQISLRQVKTVKSIHFSPE